MDEARARELLELERGRIERALASVEDARASSGEEREPGDGGSEDLYELEVETGLGDDLGERLAAVERAEERLATGTFGLSVDSGTPIPDERLEAMPTAERTVEEQQALGA